MLLIKKLSNSSSKLYRIRYTLALLWLVIRGKVSILVMHDIPTFLNMTSLEKTMKNFPKKFNVNFEYSLMEERPFLAVSIQTTSKVKHGEKSHG